MTPEEQQQIKDQFNAAMDFIKDLTPDQLELKLKQLQINPSQIADDQRKHLQTYQDALTNTQEAFKIIKSTYQNYEIGDSLTEEMSFKIKQVYLYSSLWTLKTKKGRIIAILLDKPVQATQDHLLSLLHKVRSHPQHPPIKQTKLIDSIEDIQILKDLAFLDYDVPDGFSGYLFMSCNYFKYNPFDKTKFNNDYDENSTDHCCINGYFPIDNCQSEFRRKGFMSQLPDSCLKEEYSYVVIATALFKAPFQVDYPPSPHCRILRPNDYLKKVSNSNNPVDDSETST